MAASLSFHLDGRSVEVPDDGASLLQVLRERLGVRSAKDGCSPQGQCGCCTVLVDGRPRVACVTPARRVAGRAVTTLEGLDPEIRSAWADAFVATGASQCGFCTPGIIVRLAALEDRRPSAVERALLAHLCRCTGWRTIVDAATAADIGPAVAPSGASECEDATRPAIPDRPPPVARPPVAARPAIPDRPPPIARPPVAASPRDHDAASRRAHLEGGVPQRVGRHVALGAAGFADDIAPPDALVAVPDRAGGWAVGESLAEARAAAGKIQGRNTTLPLSHPVDVPAGDWRLTLRTTWIEPGYLEPDASWCEPGGEPATPLANGGAFGGKLASPAPAVARRLADQYGRAVRVVLAREDVVRLGPKRPPLAAGVRDDGTGVVRVVRTPGIADAMRSVAPRFDIEEVDVAGPPTSSALRAAGWAEAAVLLAALRGESAVTSPAGARAEAAVEPGGPNDDRQRLRVRVACGEPLDAVVLRSYCIGAAHMALGWVRSEGIAVDAEGRPHDLTIRSFGILRASDMPEVEVEIVPEERPPVNGSDAVFAATAAATWMAAGLPQDWPIARGRVA